MNTRNNVTRYAATIEDRFEGVYEPQNASSTFVVFEEGTEYTVTTAEDMDILALALLKQKEMFNIYNLEYLGGMIYFIVNEVDSYLSVAALLEEHGALYTTENKILVTSSRYEAIEIFEEEQHPENALHGYDSSKIEWCIK